jgi:uncharacterized cofD-like protein
MEPGLQIKRWLLLLVVGVAFVSLSLAALLRAFYPLPAYFYMLTLQFLPRAVRAVLLFLVGGGCIGASLWGLNRSLLAPFLANTERSYPELLYEYRHLERGPRIVVIGGGHGQATLLRGLKSYTSNLTAIVTVADDGGSSGRLRRELGILPPGDFRNCIAALADDESLVTRVLQYRFRSSAGLDQHSFGNLFISAMSSVTGSFESALAESSRVLAVRGQVMPSTLEPVVLGADVQVGDETPRRVYGESQIPKVGGRVLRVLLEPGGPRAYPGAVQAILKADLIVVGPGSLYTSILPNLLVPEIVEAMRASQAPKVYVCNVATQRGETDGYAAEEHLQALETHIGPGIFTTVVVNEPVERVELPAGTTWVAPELQARAGLKTLRGDLVGDENPWQHDSQKLAFTILGMVQR